MARQFFQTRPIQNAAQLRETLILNSRSEGQCRLWEGPVNDKYGVLHVTFRGDYLKLRVHRLAYYLHGPTQRLTPPMHVSHRCHNPLCIKLSHLSYEPARINNARQVCKVEGYCSGHRGFKKCLLSLW